MTNKLLLCCGCKERFPRESMFKLQPGWFHNIECAKNYGIDRAKKNAITKQKKINAEFDRNFRENDPRTRRKAAKFSCHRYIRERDKGETCICCGRPLGKNYDAGHFLESGNYSHLRYDERNIHAQSVYCNQYKGGNSDDYEKRLRIKIGDAAVDEMKASKSKITKRTVEDYKAIEDYYNRKYKELLNERFSKKNHPSCPGRPRTTK